MESKNKKLLDDLKDFEKKFKEQENLINEMKKNGTSSVKELDSLKNIIKEKENSLKDISVKLANAKVYKYCIVLCYFYLIFYFYLLD